MDPVPAGGSARSTMKHGTVAPVCENAQPDETGGFLVWFHRQGVSGQFLIRKWSGPSIVRRMALAHRLRARVVGQ
jgi:hypothetical protein